MSKFIVTLAALFISLSAQASTASASHGHHGGGNNGALGASSGAFGGSTSTGGSSASAQSGQGGTYWEPNPHASLVDAYQPWPESEMRQFQKP